LPFGLQAVACQHRSIPFTVYERDASFAERSQGYGLTMQQASKAFQSFGITLEEGITSTQHFVHTPDGTVVGSWGLRKWGRPDDKKEARRQNIHIARQSLRRQLLEAMGGTVEWSCQLIDLEQGEHGVKLTIQRGNATLERTADLVVGADGIRSTTRRLYLGEDQTPLRYLGCLVVLGIAPLAEIANTSALLDGESVFQTADGTTRLYAMPYSSDKYMWQLSFPLDEQQAKDVSLCGPLALKAEAQKRCGSWHTPIPQLLEVTPLSLVSGYPVYDRSILSGDVLNPKSRVTLLGDSAHPMSPFKGQGANCAILDGLDLAKAIYKSPDNLERAIQVYEATMLARSTVKVKASAEAADFLHTEVAIQVGDLTRGAAASNTIPFNNTGGSSTVP
jgi:2-polyprenyl-6-methoxyphenol hydroxylase-like FAD-dependent oxidoreductase